MMEFNVLIQIGTALLTGAILGGVAHLWLKTERLDRELATHAERTSQVATTVKELRDALEALRSVSAETRDSVARIEGQLTSGFAAGAKAPRRR